MPLFFFDIVDGKMLPDRQGLELENMDAAQAHAVEIASTFLRQRPSELWRENAWSIGIREAGGHTSFYLDVRVSVGQTRS